MVGAAVLERSSQRGAVRRRAADVPSGGDTGSPGFMLSGVQALVLCALAGAEGGMTAAELAAVTAGARTTPVAPAVAALEARSLAWGHERLGAGQRAAWAWSLTTLGRRIAEAMTATWAAVQVVEVEAVRVNAAEARQR